MDNKILRISDVGRVNIVDQDGNWHQYTLCLNVNGVQDYIDSKKIDELMCVLTHQLSSYFLPLFS